MEVFLMKRFTLILLTVITTTGWADPRLWDPRGLAIQQSGRIEWDRTAVCNDAGYMLAVWSDMHSGNREIYAQLVSPTGELVWPESGVQVTNERHEQSFPVVTVTDGGWIVAWIDYRNDPRRDPANGMPTGPGGDLYAQKLNDQGQPLWSANGIVVDASTGIFRGSLALVSDDAGGALVSWDGYLSYYPEIRAQRINSSGQPAWPGLVTIQNSMWNTAYCYIRTAEDGAGGMFVTWPYGGYSIQDIYASRITADGEKPWGNSVLVSDHDMLQQEPVVCSDSSGGCYVAWYGWVSGSNNSDVWAQRYNSNGEALWAANGIPVCNAIGYQTNVMLAPSMVEGTSDGCLFAWSDQRNTPGPDSYYAQMLLLDGTPLWDVNGIPLSAEGYSSEQPGLCSDGNGGLVATWAEDGVRATHLNTFGQSVWPEAAMPVSESGSRPVVLRQSDGISFVFAIPDYAQNLSAIHSQKLDFASGEPLFGSDGVTVAAFENHDAYAVSAVPMSGGRTAIISGDATYRIINSEGQREAAPDSAVQLPDTSTWRNLSLSDACPDGSGGFFVATYFGNDESGIRSFLSHVLSTGELVNDDPVEIWPVSDWQYAYNARVSADSQGGAYVAFHITDNPVYGSFLLRFNSDCQPLWNEPLQLSDQDTYMPFSLATQPNGHCTIVWRPWYWAEEPDSVVRMAEVAPDGTMLWNIGVCDSSTHADDPMLLADGQGGAYCVWADGRIPSSGRIYAQHVNSNGEHLWPFNGLPVSNATVGQLEPKASVDPAGNLLAVWVDQTDNTNENIFAQKLSPDGTRQWTESGRVVCQAPFGQFSPDIVTDGADGCFITWQDYRVFAPNLYGTHLDADGNAGPDPYWEPNRGGLISDSAAEVVDFFSLVSGSDGSAIVFWSQDIWQSDTRALDVFAQRFTAMGTAVDHKSAPVPQRFALNQNYPNPFNPVTEISFAIPATSHTRLTVFDLLGRQVSTLVEQMMTAGDYRIPFDASALPSGVYFYRLEAGTFSASRKMVLLK
jgi:hypothetical protein